MKKILKITLLFVLFSLFSINVYAKSNPYPKEEESLFGGKIINCTWYAWQQAKDRMGVELPFWTYVQTWYSKAQKAGYSVGKEPKPNSIMVWDYGEGFGGHVAYVTAVNGKNVSYTEGGSPMTESGINNDTMSIDDMSSFLVGFIYLDKVPTNNNANKDNNTNNKNNNTDKNNINQNNPPKNNNSTDKVTTEKKKSNNNYLSRLKVSAIDFEFNKEILEYNLTIANEVEEVIINSTPEDTSATITGNDTYKLIEGINNYIISVKAEDASIREYKINILREAKVEPSKEEKNEEESVPKQENVEINSNNKRFKINKKTIFIISATAILLLIIIIIYIFKRSKLK